MNVVMYANTNGRGLWSDVAREVKIVKLTLNGVNDHETYEFSNKSVVKNLSGELRAYFNTGSWPYHKTKYPGWSINSCGLIYTDPQWIREFRAGLEQLGMPASLANGVDYTEQGAQGVNYVSMGVYGRPLLSAFMLGVKVKGSTHGLPGAHINRVMREIVKRELDKRNG